LGLLPVNMFKHRKFVHCRCHIGLHSSAPPTPHQDEHSLRQTTYTGACIRPGTPSGYEGGFRWPSYPIYTAWDQGGEDCVMSNGSIIKQHETREIIGVSGEETL